MLHNLCKLHLMRIRTEGIFVCNLFKGQTDLFRNSSSYQSSIFKQCQSQLIFSAFYDLLTQLAVISRKQTCHSRTPKGASFCPTFMFFATLIHTLALGPVIFTVSLKTYSFFTLTIWIMSVKERIDL